MGDKGVQEKVSRYPAESTNADEVAPVVDTWMKESPEVCPRCNGKGRVDVTAPYAGTYWEVKVGTKKCPKCNPKGAGGRRRGCH